MKILVTMKIVLDTEDIENKMVRHTIERSALNKIKDNVAGTWALEETSRHGGKREITLDCFNHVNKS